ncbi:hypothetical protein HU200_014910 [Digitaria exilis]|uniref:VWFA domain-containing protein n=1 Tax=Digitaria exilis TaxID=1010633 RepID=A0A835FBP2_9POAL|nr:hypothetical protein HU200_014910 [Digitaria exilis]
MCLYTAGSTKSLVAINQVKYLKDNAALTVDTVTAEVEIKATTCTAVREGLDLVAILDVSSRMATKMDNLKNAMKFVIMKLTPVDRLSIVIFSDGAARLNPLRSMTPDAHKDLIALVNGLKAHAHGGTNIRVGLETGLAVVTGRANTKARTPNIFLVTDGMQTISNAKNVDASQVAIYTFGFGNDSDHNLLSDIALKSHGGLFSAVPDGTNLSVPLSQLLGGLLTVVGQDLQLTLTPNKDEGDDVDTIVVAPGTHYTQTVDPTTGVITISFGTIFAGESRKVIITINLKKSTKKTEYDAALSEAQTIFTAQGKVHNHMAPRDITILRVTNPSQLVPGSSDTSRELQAELARRAEADAIRKARLLADAGNLDGARYTLVNAQNALEDVVLSDGQKLVVNTLLRAELVQLVKLMDSKVIYESKGRAYALASEASHGRQRYACRGGEDDDVRLFSTPRMDSYLEQAKSFEKDPTVTVASADEDVKKEVEANPLAAISGDLALYLRTAIEALQGMRRIIAAKA